IPGNSGSSYVWSVTGGTITGGQGSTTISVRWDSWSSPALSVTETLPGDCTYTTSLSIEVVPSPITGEWRYFRPLTVDNGGNGSALTDFQIQVTLNTQSLIDQGKMN